MKRIYWIVIIFALISSCNKNNENTKELQLLQLNTLKKAYYNSDNKRYLEKSFTTDSLTYEYNIVLEKGKKYRFLIYGMQMQDVNLSLTNSSSVLVAEGVQADVGLTAKFFKYEPVENDTFMVKISTEDQNLAGKTFFLAIEEINSYEITWLGRTWICDGDWSVDAKDKLTFKGYNSGFSKWMKLKDNNLRNYTSVLVFETETGVLPTFVGLACNATDSIWDMLNLPEQANEFKITGSNTWEFWWINNSVGREVGTFKNDNNNVYSMGITKSDSVTCFVNDNIACKYGYNSTTNKGFYIIIEDKNVDEFVFTDFDIQ